MERKKNLFLILFLILISFSQAQHKALIYEAYSKGDMESWKRTMDQLDVKKNKTMSEKLNMVNYQYGYIAWCIDNDLDDEAEHYIDKAYYYLDELEKKEYELAQVYAYKAAMIGFKIGLSPYKAPFIGPDSESFAKKSIQLEPGNAMGHIQLGNITFYKPSFLGGSREKAIKHFLQALEIREAEAEKIQMDWNYLNLLAIIIYAYKEMEQYEMAELYCKKALKFEPDFDWVSDQLYPEVVRSLKLN